MGDPMKDVLEEVEHGIRETSEQVFGIIMCKRKGI